MTLNSLCIDICIGVKEGIGTSLKRGERVSQQEIFYQDKIELPCGFTDGQVKTLQWIYSLHAQTLQEENFNFSFNSVELL